MKITKTIIEFIAIDSEQYASLMAKKIWLEIKRIEKNPKQARKVPEAGYLDEIREFILGQYLFHENRQSEMTVLWQIQRW